MRYQQYLDQKKKQEKKKRDGLQKDLDDAIVKKKIEKSITTVFGEAIAKAKKAEEKHDSTLLNASNGLRKKATDMKKDLPNLEKEIEKLKRKLQA